MTVHFEQREYLTCSMEEPGGEFIVRFLEDTGVPPLQNRQSILIMLIYWVCITIGSFIVISIVARSIKKNVYASSEILSRIDLNDLEDTSTMAIAAQENSPSELDHFFNEYRAIIEK